MAHKPVSEMTLSEVLAYNYLSHRPTSQSGRRDVLDKQGVIFTGKAHEAWAWLRETGRIP